jgi:shikimate kinase
MNVVLIGYRGCGKTTVGRLLAERNDAAFIDTDELIVHQSGRSIAEIFASDGEPHFRKLEEAAIKLATESKNRVLSVGGGAVESNRNQSTLRNYGTVIWLQANADSLWKRISSDAQSLEQRPDLASGGLEEVRQILERRTPIYAKLAHLAISTTDRHPKAIVEDIEAWLEIQ